MSAALAHHTIPLPSAFSPKFIERFWSRVDQSGGPSVCWPWTRSKTPAGYGRVNHNHAVLYTHRIAYVLATGEDITGLHICHACDNPLCCNPAHLWSGTALDNMRDRDAKGRGHLKPVDPAIQRNIQELRDTGHTLDETERITGCGRGAVLKYGGPRPNRKPRHVLTTEDKRECRRLRDEGLTYREIAERIDSTMAPVWFAVNRWDDPSEPAAA